MDATTVEELAARADALASGAAGRRLLGITGAPGSGKSTLARALAIRLNGVGPAAAGRAPRAVVVPMDGFHLAQAELERLGRADRKGAPDTFDVAGFVALLARLRAADEEVTYAPAFRREIEEPVAGAIPVPREVPLVIVEGNYLLVDSGEWAPVAGLLDECWYVEVDEAVRLQRLVARHREFGRSPEAAEAFAHGSDQANAEVIAATRGRADLVVRLG